MTWDLALFVILFVTQIVVYAEAFAVKPAGDDFNAPLADVWRGEAEGPAALLTRSAQPHNYRPLQSLSIWLFAGPDDEHRLTRIHILAFTGMFVFAAAAFFWFRALPVSGLAKAGGAAALFMHPALVAPVAGIDGFSTLFSQGFMWLCVYCVWRWRTNLAVGVPLSAVVLAMALGFKEYALGAGPLVCAAILCFSHSWSEVLRRGLIVGISLALVVGMVFVIRRYTIPPPMPGQEIGYFRFDIVQWIRNAALFGGALLFPGSTKWLFLNGSSMAWALGGTSIGLLGATLGLGAWRLWRLERTRFGDAAWTERKRWLAFSLLGITGASFPAVLIFHVSEMYVAGMVLPFALLVALALQGVRAMPWAWRACAMCILVAALLWAVGAVRSKVSDLRRMGDDAEDMLRQIIAHLPADARDLTIAMTFPDESHRTPAYSVFEIRRPLQVEQPQALWWLRPHRGLNIVFPQPTLAEAMQHADRYDAILQWNHRTETMELVSNRPAN